MIDYKDLGQRVRVIRRRHSLTQEELAEKVGISASFLGHIERGSRIASLETLVALCNTLKVSPQYLLCASLTDEFTEHMPPILSPEDRNNLGPFLLLSTDTITNWTD